MFGQDRNRLRQVFFDAWDKHRRGRPLEPLEQQIVMLLEQHPEYHTLFAAPERELDRDYLPEAGSGNPFLHLSLHLAIRDQLALDRPAGVRQAMAAITAGAVSAHEAEHLAMEQLSEALWSAQRNGTPPDEERYLEQLQELARRYAKRL